MSISTSTLPVNGTESTLLARLSTSWMAYRARRDRRDAARTLEGMSDHFLKDIGITRSEIQSVVFGLKTERKRGDED